MTKTIFPSYNISYINNQFLITIYIILYNIDKSLFNILYLLYNILQYTYIFTKKNSSYCVFKT